MGGQVQYKTEISSSGFKKHILMSVSINVIFRLNLLKPLG